MRAERRPGHAASPGDFRGPLQHFLAYWRRGAAGYSTYTYKVRPTLGNTASALRRQACLARSRRGPRKACLYMQPASVFCFLCSLPYLADPACSAGTVPSSLSTTPPPYMDTDWSRSATLHTANSSADKSTGQAAVSAFSAGLPLPAPRPRGRPAHGVYKHGHLPRR